mmetsp:Transcript_106876/g.297603  ORF Transcript_106876/g.297603 Transcript_106876/m.297603 type:complete len:337 (-) Transcript_106876:19-1029(-)
MGIHGQVLHAEHVGLIALDLDLVELELAFNGVAAHVKVHVVDLIAVVAHVEGLQVDRGEGIPLHGVALLLRQDGGADVEGHVAALVARVDGAPAALVRTAVAVAARAAVVAVLAAAAADLPPAAAGGGDEVVEGQLEVVDVVPEELLATAPGLTAPAVEDLARMAVEASVLDPPDLVLHAQAGHPLPRLVATVCGRCRHHTEGGSHRRAQKAAATAGEGAAQRPAPHGRSGTAALRPGARRRKACGGKRGECCATGWQRTGLTGSPGQWRRTRPRNSLCGHPRHRRARGLEGKCKRWQAQHGGKGRGPDGSQHRTAATRGCLAASRAEGWHAKAWT